MYDMTGIILSGGKSIRMGDNKAFIKLGGERIIDRTVRLFRTLFTQSILVTNEPLAYACLDIELAVDIIPKSGSLIGIYTGLFYAVHQHCFVTACDMPFINERVIEYLIAMDENYDVVIPRFEDGYHPLCARYSKRCMRYMEESAREDNLRIVTIFDKVNVREVSSGEIAALDPNMRSFFNINTPEDLKKAGDLL